MQLDLELSAERRYARARRLPRVTVSRRAVAIAGMSAVAGLAFAVYLTTLAPTVMWYDMGEFATASATLGIAHNTGYPLLILLGKLFTFLPVGDAAYRVNLLSAVCTALAVAVAFGIVHDLTDDPVAAAIGAFTLAFAATVWADATWATSYGLNLLLTAVIVRSMLGWWRERKARALVVAALALGLGMADHRLIVLTAPPSALLLVGGWRSLRPRVVAAAATAFLAGLAVYAYLPIRGAQDPALSWARPADWHTYWSMFFTGETRAAYWRLDVLSRLDVLWTYPSYDLTWPGLALAAAGFVFCALRRRAVAVYAAVLLALDAAIVLTYSIHNIYNYLTPAYLMLCVLIGVGASELLAAVRHGAGVRVPGRACRRPRVAVTAAAVALALIPAALFLKNDARVSRYGDYSARDFAQTTLDHLPPRAVVLTDSWAAPPLWYVQLVEGQRRDVLVSPIFSVPGDDPAAFAQRQIDAGRPVYVAEGLRTPLAPLAQRFHLQPVLLDSIEEMIVNVLPKPAYRDDLVASGSLYAVLPSAADPVVGAVPPDAARDVAFPQGVTLVGFAGARTAARGDVVRLTYYWRADAPVAHDLGAATIFADARGDVANMRGMPSWSQVRLIGEGARLSSSWQAGQIVRESYYVLVPRTIAPGAYDVRLSVYGGSADAAARGDASRAVSIGTITVR